MEVVLGSSEKEERTRCATEKLRVSVKLPRWHTHSFCRCMVSGQAEHQRRERWAGAEAWVAWSYMPQV